MRLTTPLGDLVTFSETGAFDTRNHPPIAAGILPSGANWRRWLTESATIEVFVGQYAPVLPLHMHLEGCQAVVWRVLASQTTVGLSCSCQWLTLALGAEGGPDSGEGLEALTWRLGDRAISLGTGRADYLDNGLRASFPVCTPGELVQVHFVVAWATERAPDACATWFAVDQPVSEIVKQLFPPMESAP